MRLYSILLTICAAIPSLAFAAYDNSWHQEEFWAGEYPNGFAVVRKNVVIRGRAAMYKRSPRNISCKLPYRAVFHPWNRQRNALGDVRYFTASKIIALLAKENFTFTPDTGEGAPINITKGDVIDYLIYGAEGMFTIRINGKKYSAGQDLLEHCENVPQTALKQDEWLNLNCENGQRAWISMDDVLRATPSAGIKYFPGLADVGPGLVKYGVVRDLTGDEARAKAF